MSVGESGGGRHAGREVALQVLYAIDLGATGPRDAAHARAVKAAEEAAAPPRAPRSMRTAPTKRSTAVEVDAEAIGEGAVVDLDPVEASGVAFDRIVEHFGWHIQFLLSGHMRDALLPRLADLPVPVVIDEAVDLARRFGSDTSPLFVNGVLDAIARELHAA